MLSLAVLLWICLELSAPAWCFWLLAACAASKIVGATIHFLTWGAKLNE